MSGVTATGFEARTVDELEADLIADMRAVFGAGVNVDPRSRPGQLIAVLAERFATIWDLAEAVANALDPASASGAQLDAICALTGTVRKTGTVSNVTVILAGTAGTSIPAARLKVDGQSVTFELLAPGSLVVATSWSAGAVAAGATRKNDGSVWVALTAGTAAVAPTGAGPTFVDGTITWRRIGAGDGTRELVFVGVGVGPLQAYAGTLTVIDTPIAGWTGAFNFLDATPGTNPETDAELRLRREQEITDGGTATVPSIRAALLKVVGVTEVHLFENTTDATVGTLTPHSIEALVTGGADADIRAALFASVAAGIATVGTTSGTVTDSEGYGHTIKFSRPTTVDVYATVTIVKDPTLYPTNGDDLVAQAIVDAGNARAQGRDVVASQVAASIWDVPGVLDVTSTFIGTAPSPGTSTTIVLTIRQKAAYDTTRVVVTSIDGTP